MLLFDQRVESRSHPDAGVLDYEDALVRIFQKYTIPCRIGPGSTLQMTEDCLPGNMLQSVYTSLREMVALASECDPEAEGPS